MSIRPPLDDARYRVRTDGSILSGYTRENVAHDLVLVLDWDEAAVLGLLDGVLVDLKRSLTDGEATDFVRLLESTGLRVWRELEAMEPELAFRDDLAPRPAPRALPVDPGRLQIAIEPFEAELDRGASTGKSEWFGNDAHAIPLDEPLQPETVARASFPPPARDLPGARAEAARLARSRPGLETTATMYARPDAQAEAPSLVSFEGRIGRVRYLVRSVLAPTMLMIAPLFLLPFAPRASLALSLLVFFACFVLSVSAAVVRLHDIGVSGVVALVPMLMSCVVQPAVFCGLGPTSPTHTLVSITTSGLSLLLALVLAFVPGNAAENAYGPPTVADPPVYRVVAVILVLALLVESLAAYRVLVRAMPAELVEAIEMRMTEMEHRRRPR